MSRAANEVVSILAASACACLIAASGVAPTLAQGTQQGHAQVVVIIRGLRNDHGQVIGAIYDSPRAWLAENRAADACRAPIHHGEARCVLFVPARARVAFCGMHDEDGDGAFDRDMLGIPQEGYAFSNDVREPFGPPSFEAAAFRPDDVGAFVVNTRYGI